MLTRPSDILCPPDIHDPQFSARYLAWTAQILSDTRKTIAATRLTLDESKDLLKQADRLLAWK